MKKITLFASSLSFLVMGECLWAGKTFVGIEDITYDASKRKYVAQTTGQHKITLIDELSSGAAPEKDDLPVKYEGYKQSGETFEFTFSSSKGSKIRLVGDFPSGCGAGSYKEGKLSIECPD